MAVSSLAEATSVKAVDPNSYSVDFIDEWCIGTGEKLHHLVGLLFFQAHPLSQSPMAAT